MSPRDLLRALAGVALIAVAGCVSDVPPAAFSPGPAASSTPAELSGEYCWYGPDVSARTFRRGLDAIPFLDLEALAVPALVQVEATPERLLFRYEAADGGTEESVFEVRGAGSSWSEGVLTVLVPVRGPARRARLFRLADGRLVMTESVVHKGITMEPVVFFTREDSVAVVLEPAELGCGASAGGIPRQPWFEPGVDVRDPVCRARIEREIVSMLSTKGEDPAVAASLARDACASLRSAADAGDIRISSPSNADYAFRAERKGRGCVLRLVSRRKTRGRVRIWVETSAKRSLPECACN